MCFINSASLLLESVLFEDQPPGLQIVDQAGPELHPWPSSFILDLPPAACSLTKEADRHLLPSPRASALHSHLPCLLPTACNCSVTLSSAPLTGSSFRSSGHGRCLRCRAHTAGPHRERCQENFYRWNPRIFSASPATATQQVRAARPPPQPHHRSQALAALRPFLPRPLRLQCDDLGTCAASPR